MSEVQSETSELSELMNSLSGIQIGSDDIASVPASQTKPPMCLQERVWRDGQTPKPSDLRLLCLNLDCSHPSRPNVGPLAKSHFIPAFMLRSLGYGSPHYNLRGECSPRADNGPPMWTRLLLCSACEQMQGDDSPLLCTIDVRGARKKKTTFARVDLFRMRKSPKKSWLERIKDRRGKMEVSQLQFQMKLTEECDTLFSKLIWRCRLKLSCDHPYDQEVISKLHQWPLNEPYLVWVDIGETHDDGVIPSNKLFSRAIDYAALEYHVRFFLYNVWYGHIQIGHVHFILGDALRLLGFEIACLDGGSTVLFGSAPEPLKAVFRNHRSLLGQRFMDGASESFPDTMRQFREAGYDPIESPSNSRAVIEENFRKWIGHVA